MELELSWDVLLGKRCWQTVAGLGSSLHAWSWEIVDFIKITFNIWFIYRAVEGKGRQRNKNVMLLFLFFLLASFCWKANCQHANWEDGKRGRASDAKLHCYVSEGWISLHTHTHTQSNCRDNLLFQELVTKVIACLPEEKCLKNWL